MGIISGVGCNRKSHAALGTDSAAGNGDGAAFAAGAFAAADACGIPATFGLNVAAGNVDGAAISTTAATDACAAVSAEGFNVAAVNGDIAAFAAVAAADACSIGQAISCNLAAMDGDGAATLEMVAADACLISRAFGNQRTHPLPLGLGIDGEGFALWNVDALVCIEGGAVGKDQVDSSFDLNSVGNSYCSLDGIPYAVFKGEGFFIFVEYGSFYVLLGSVFVQIFRRAAYAKTVFIEDVLCRFTLEITVFTGILVVLLIQINRGEVSMTFVTGLNHHGLAGGVERTTFVFCPLGIGFRCKAIQRFAHGELEIGIFSGVGFNRKSHNVALGTDSAAGNGDGAFCCVVAASADACGSSKSLCSDGAAGNIDGAACAFVATADACGIIATFCIDTAAGNIDGAAAAAGAAVVAVAASDACSIVSTNCIDTAAGNFDDAAVTVFSAANACGIITAYDINGAAIDVDSTGRFSSIAADGCFSQRSIQTIIRMFFFGVQRTRTIPLAVDAQGFARRNVDALFGIEGEAVGKDQVDSSFDLNSVGNSYCSLDGIPYAVFKGEGFYIIVREYGSFFDKLVSIFVQIFRRAAYAKTVFIEVVICRFTLEITVFTGNLVVIGILINRSTCFFTGLNHHGLVGGVERTTSLFCPLGISFRFKAIQLFAHGELEIGIFSGVGCSGVCPTAALGCDGAALDGDGAAAAAVAAADACAATFADGFDGAAGNGDGAAAVGVVVEEVAAADACATIIARSCNVAAGNGDGAAVVVPAAADACGIHATFGLNVAAGNIDDAAVAAVAAADACGIIAAIGCNLAAGNGDVAAVSAVAAADACAAVSAGGFNVAAVNGDGAACATLVAADACLISRAFGNQLTLGILLGLGIDGEGFALGNVDALICIEGGVVGKDQADTSLDFQTVGNLHGGRVFVRRNHIPAGAEGNTAPALKLLGNGFFLFSVFVQIFRQAAYAKTVDTEVVLCQITLEITVFTGNLVVSLIQINRGEGIMFFIARLNLHGLVGGVRLVCLVGIGYRRKLITRITHGEH